MSAYWPTEVTPATPISRNNTDSPLDSAASARSDLDTVIQRLNDMQTALNYVIAHGEPALVTESWPAPVPFSATPTISTTGFRTQVFYFGTLTANVTSMTISGAENGRPIMIRFKQDATGGRTIALPSGAVVGGLPNTTANAVSWLTLIWVDPESRFEGFWSALP